MSIAEMLHGLTAEGRSTVLDDDLVRLTREYPALVSVFEEVQFLRGEVVNLLDQIDMKDQEIANLK